MKQIKYSTSIPPMLLFLILLCNIIPPLAVDEYTPSMPYMMQPLESSVSLMQFTVSIYMLTFCIAQIISGFLSDSFGRRPVLLLSMPLFFVGSVICIYSTNITVLLIGRAFQGLGVGACSMTAPALMADCFEGMALKKVVGYFSTVYSFIPISAPVLGGIIQDLFGWEANFIFMFLLSIIIYFIFLICLPETHKPTAEHDVTFKNIIKNYAAVLTHKQYMLSVLCLALTWSLFVVFSIMAPFIMHQLGFTASEYGVQALLVGLAFFLGNALNNFLITRMLSDHIVILGLAIMIVMSALLVFFPLIDMISAITIMIPIFFIMLGAGLIFPHLYEDAVKAIPKYAGIAGALIGSLILLGAVVITAFITVLDLHSAMAMASMYLALGLICYVNYLIIRKNMPTQR